MFIYELNKWPKFTWHDEKIGKRLADLRHEQGRLLGQMEMLGFQVQQETVLQTLTDDVLKSSEIEGERLELSQVRSSIARRLGIDIGGVAPANRHVDGIVEMMLDATRHYDRSLTEDRLFGWHAALFPSGRSGMRRIRTGAWRDDLKGPMQVVSGPEGRERVHFEAPPAEKLQKEMRIFIEWYNDSDREDLVLKAALAHLWFVTLHPFEDGNGRIARALADMTLARSEKSSQRFYSMSAQILLERNDYYDILETIQQGTLDVTSWMEWFIVCLGRAIESAQGTLSGVLSRARFWKSVEGISFNERQRAMLQRLLAGFRGKLTTTKWAKLTKSSQDTALRDILDLVDKKVLIKNSEGGRSTSYALAEVSKSGWE
jgi:Fic family protein